VGKILIKSMVSLLIPPLEKGGEGGFYNKNNRLFLIFKISPNPSLPKRGERENLPTRLREEPKNKYRIENNSSFIFCPSLSLRHSAGFTLIELIIVLMIIGISMGLVGMFVNQGASNLELKRGAREVATTLKYARNQAVSMKKVYSFVIRESDGTYSLYASDIAGHNEGAAPESVMSRTLPDKLKVKFDERREGSLRIDFFPGGNSTGGVINILNQADSNLSVTVNRVTGKVEIRKNQNSY